MKYKMKYAQLSLSPFSNLQFQLTIGSAEIALYYVIDSILMLGAQQQVGTDKVSFSLKVGGICIVITWFECFLTTLKAIVSPSGYLSLHTQTKHTYKNSTRLKHLRGMNHRADNCCYRCHREQKSHLEMDPPL